MKSDLEKYVGKMFVHTNKAVTKKDCPADRLFLVVRVVYPLPVNSDEPFLLAWKCEFDSTTFWHPAYPTKRYPLAALTESPEMFFIEEGKNHAIPTATFTPDSLYKLYKVPKGFHPAISGVKLEVRAGVDVRFVARCLGVRFPNIQFSTLGDSDNLIYAHIVDGYISFVIDSIRDAVEVLSIAYIDLRDGE